MKKITDYSYAILACAVIVTLGSISGAMTYAYVIEREKVQAMSAQRLAVQEVEEYIATNIPRMPVIERRGYAEVFVEAARANGLHHSLVASVAIVESHFARNALSEQDAIGIMQIVPEWWVGVAPGVIRRSDLYSPDINIKAGAWILAHYAELCGPARMLACYESGPRAIDTGYTAKVERVRWNQLYRMMGGTEAWSDRTGRSIALHNASAHANY